MARYDGLIIPRSYSEYINKTDSATLQQALQQSGVLDSAPTEDSVKAVKSGGVFDALAGKQPTLTFDNVPTEDSDNPVKSGGIYDALETKQDTLTFDDTPTANSNHPVKSSGLVNAVPVNEVTNNNMHSVTSNAVALEAILKVDFANPTYLGMGTAVGQFTLNNSIENYKLIMVGVNYSNGEDNRTAIQLLPTIILVNRNTQKNSLAATLYFSTNAYIGVLFHYVDNRHLYIDQIDYSTIWTTGGVLQVWGIK